MTEHNKDSEHDNDPKHPDLSKTKERFPVTDPSEEIDELVKEEEELEELKTKIEYEKIKRDEEREIGLLFLEVDNSIDIQRCRESLGAMFNSNSLESCLGFCHRYSVWYFDNKMFKSISLMNEMFDLISEKIIGNNLHYKVNPPDPELADVKSVQFKYEQFNFMDNYNYIYGNEGVDLRKFIGDY